jgi:hypothetical protein
MSDGALRADVIAALTQQKGVSVTPMPDGSIEVSAVGQPIRRFPLGPVVSRGVLWNFERWYGVPIGSCYPSTRVKPKSNAAGE